MYSKAAPVSRIALGVCWALSITCLPACGGSGGGGTDAHDADTDLDASPGLDASSDLGADAAADLGTDMGGPTCGNGTVDDGEQCETGVLNGFDCESLGYSGGTLNCTECSFDTDVCFYDTDPGGGGCGDGRIDDGEACDTNNLNGFSCELLGFSGGTLRCTDCEFDTGLCAFTPPPFP